MGKKTRLKKKEKRRKKTEGCEFVGHKKINANYNSDN